MTRLTHRLLAILSLMFVTTAITQAEIRQFGPADPNSYTIYNDTQTIVIK